MQQRPFPHGERPYAQSSRQFRKRTGKPAASFACLIAALIVVNCHAGVRLPSLIGDNMVLQRDCILTIWGYADTRETVEVSFRDSISKVIADDAGRWSLTLPPQAAGGPDSMTVKARNTIVVRNILVGDVWVASGQSNMEFALKDVDDSQRAITGADDSQIRLFRVPHRTTAKPRDDLDPARWQLSSPSAAADFSAVAYLFAQQLRKRHEVPIGLIQTTWSGTYAESWVSPDTLRSFPEFAERLGELERVTPAQEAEYEQYMQVKTRWSAAHRREDRGMASGSARWAQPELDTKDWPQIELPRPDSAWGTDFKGFDGTVWYRREVVLPPAFEGQDIELHLGAPFHEEEAYFNGARATALPPAAGVYRVPGDRVHAGRSVITIRLTGSDGYIMISGKPEDLFLRAGDARIPLAGNWLYQPGADLAALPTPPPLANYYGFPGIAVLSNAMIEPLTRYPIKGVIWYQGESNVGAAEQYRKLFPALIADWRRRWRSDFAFLFVQLAGYLPNPEHPADTALAELREAQQAALGMPRTGMATAIDLGDPHDVHPKNKRDVAVRLALSASKIAYGADVQNSGPTLRAFRIEGGRIRIQLDHAGSGLVARDRYGYVRGFAIAAKDGPFVWAQAVLDGADVLVSSVKVAEPARVRYGWANTPEGNLYNAEGLPTVPFRTDATWRVTQP